MFGSDYTDPFYILCLDGGDLLCWECFEEETRTRAKDRYGDRFGTEKAEHLAELAENLTYTLTYGKSWERKKAHRQLEKILEYSFEWGTKSMLEGGGSWENAHLVCDNCQEFFFPDVVEDLSKTEDFLKRFETNAKRFLKFRNRLVGPFYSILDLRDFMLSGEGGEWIPLSNPAETFLEERPWLNDSFSRLRFAREGRTYRILNINPWNPRKERFYLVPLGKLDRILTKLLTRLFEEPNLVERTDSLVFDGEKISAIDGCFPSPRIQEYAKLLEEIKA
jgi:hypothetical protein